MRFKKSFREKAYRRLKMTNPARIAVFILFFLWCGTFVFGLGWAIIASLNTHDAVVLNPMSFPTKLNFGNYAEAFRVLQTGGTSFGAMMINSVWFTVGMTAVGMATVVMAGYALGNFKFIGRNFIFTGIIVVSMIPVYGTGSATLMTFKKLGMYDSPLIILSAASMLNGNTLIVMTFFQTLSPAYEEAAKIDGAGFWTIFLKVHLPMVLPAIGAITILTLIACWNNMDTPIYYLPSYSTLASGLFKYETTAKFNMNIPVYYAGIMMCAIPPLILFAVFRDKIMTNVTIGGVK